MTWRVPAVSLRWKILLGLLLVVGIAVGTITFTMARFFHLDKKLYISDLVSAMALHSAHEAEELAASYRDRLRSWAVIADAPDLPLEAKAATLRRLLAEFPGLVAVRFQERDRDPLTLFDDTTLSAAGLEHEALEPALADPIDPVPLAAMRGVRVLNATPAPSLPLLSATVLHAREDGRAPLRVTAVVRLDDFQRIAERSQAVTIFLRDSRNQVLAARQAALVAQRARLKRPSAPGGAAVVREYEADGEAKIGSSARSRAGGIAAVSELPRSAAFVASKLLLSRLVLVALALLALAALVATVWATRITRSIAHLAEAAKAVGVGNFRVNVKASSRDEIGALAHTFNHMATELNERERALRSAQAALIQSEKMAAFGQLGAGIAHEVKNPLAGIQGIVQLSLRKAGESDPFRESLLMIDNETKRCRAIIDNLLKFARQEKSPRQATDVGAIVRDTIAILHHQLALHHIVLEAYVEPDLPLVNASANQIQQVFMNLIMNADQAFEGRPGLVRVEARASAEGGVVARVRDNGPGIPDEIVERIFEPFFTTKPAGQGTGLGLSVSFGILQDHGGHIEVETAVGWGTAFVITLPPAGEASAERRAA